MINEKRIRLLKSGTEKNGPVVYWMSRDQRVHDNWALLFAQQLAIEKKRPLLVLFNLVSEFLEATIRQYNFMLSGLRETESELKKFNIPFFIITGNPEDKVPEYFKKIDASIIVSDFDPLRIKRKWKYSVSKKIEVPFYEVDAHNIVPCIVASDKLEFAAYTIRPKINKKLAEFMDDYPELKKMKKSNWDSSSKTDWVRITKSLVVDHQVEEVNWITPGEDAAHKVLKNFLENKLDGYADNRNDPNKNSISNLSPYLHFGQISAQRIALTVQQFFYGNKSSESFLEELIIRRELSDNFCYYNKKYDSFEGFHKWAQETLNNHRKDKREFIYKLKDFECANTHEDLWNAAQKELTSTGKMHGYMRMYWAKKILEWSKSPEDALKTAIYLNDKYSIDGRDPNGYVGCAWSIGGVHDRAWTERPVFGKIRFMNRNGAKRKFDVAEYCSKFKA